MQINATFIVQMLNFALCYMVLSRFLLKPFMLSIQRKQAARQTLDAILDDKSLQEQQLIQNKHDQLAAFRVHIKKTYQKPLVTRVESPCFEEKPLCDAYVQSMIDKVTTLIVEEVPHA